MKKKAFLVGLYSLILFSLFADTFNSNLIGQKLGEYTNKSEYYLTEEASNNIITQKLFHGNELIDTTIIEEIDSVKTITKKRDIFFSIQTYSNNLIVSEENNNFSVLYNYKDNLLISKVEKDKNLNTIIYKYLYDSNNKLAAIIKIFNNDVETNFFTFAKDNLNITVTNNNKNYQESSIINGVINSIEYENDELINNIEIENKNDDETILIKSDTNHTIKEYYKSGILTKIESYINDQLINVSEFEYDDNYILIQEIIIENVYNKYSNKISSINKTITTYKNSNIQKVENYENNVLVSDYSYQGNLKIENIYENSKLYCTITLENDKIIDIQYREVSDDF
ncbi:MAG: hypothetical protein ACPKM0_07720 [Pleomorphochaeta sp.]